MHAPSPSLSPPQSTRLDPRLVWGVSLVIASAILALLARWATGWPLSLWWIVSASLVAGSTIAYDTHLRHNESRRRPTPPTIAILVLAALGGTPGALFALFGRGRKSIDGRLKFQLGMVAGIQLALAAAWFVWHMMRSN